MITAEMNFDFKFIEDKQETVQKEVIQFKTQEFYNVMFAKHGTPTDIRVGTKSMKEVLEPKLMPVKVDENVEFNKIIIEQVDTKTNTGVFVIDNLPIDWCGGIIIKDLHCRPDGGRDGSGMMM